MPEEGKPKYQAKYVPDGNTGVVKLPGKTQLPQEFITSAKSFNEALGKTVFQDQNQLNSVILYHAQLELFEMKEEIDDLTAWLNGRNAIGGFNKSLAAMTYTGIYMAEGAGIHMTKEDRKTLEELQKQKARMKRDDEQNTDTL